MKGAFSVTEKKIAIAIDGPAAAGKSTVAKKVAEKLHYVYIDTGAMYRSLTYKVLQDNIDMKDENAVLNLLKKTNILLDQHFDVYVNNEKITAEIRTSDVTDHVSLIASYPSVREEMVTRQQKLATDRGVVMDGRDIGTRVLPDAEVKVFLIASVEERAKRRHEENVTKHLPSNFEQIKLDIEKRDRMDTERTASPLKKADDAIEIDTTSLSIEDVVNKILSLVQEVE
ncbi:(d)CMP kinase [Gracilibacillus dipsosauri]|uniref:Cytidylate kinase n=1 Tax=Gracilibacillus dipsosauri TaxID=178340 RepID=A0A317KYQ2_9BACI|nr:(d)CMP kinase [Gracilibacillus dipsosauri]